MKQDRLIANLQNPELYPHDVEAFEVMETHISWVLLTGTYAYKMFKPVDLGFLDFTSLEKRRNNCDRELKLNKRLAPDLYRTLVEITGTREDPQLDGSGNVIEYMVKMKEFPQSARLDRVLGRGELTGDIIDRIADKIAEFHRSAPSSPPDPSYGSPPLNKKQVSSTIEGLLDLLEDSSAGKELERIQIFMDEQYECLKNRMETRKNENMIREVHGDLHLENVVYHRETLSVFDCVEFDPSLRWIDVVNDVSFLKMDLDIRNCKNFGWRFLNRYLEKTGDYSGVPLLRFYEIHRALIRGLVTELKRNGTSEKSRSKDPNTDRSVETYLEFVRGLMKKETPILVLLHGVSGTGKTTLSGKLLEKLGGIRVRTDVERKRLFQLAPEERSHSGESGKFGFQEGIYTEQATCRTYRRLLEVGREVLSSGHNLFLDGTYLRRVFRKEACSMADELDVPTVILSLNASEDVLKERIRARNKKREEAVSEATVEILEKQTERREPLTENEKERVISVDAGSEFDVDGIVRNIKHSI